MTYVIEAACSSITENSEHHCLERPETVRFWILDTMDSGNVLNLEDALRFVERLCGLLVLVVKDGRG
jgi:riboflavin synthase alpha subunit